MIIKFDDDINEKIGNKAKFLMLMKKNGFNVPKGIVLDSATFLKIIQDNEIEEKINKNLLNLNKDNIKEISQNIVCLFDNIKINEEIIAEIKNNLDLNKKYAVRSSGTKEDLDNYSFAGQYKTELNVCGIDNIEKAIISCYKSIYSETLLTYLLNNKIDLSNLYMSVIIQEMVEAEYSGICFTINPITGNDKQMLIEITQGLGENIVSGKVVPEQYYYNWYDNKFEYNQSNKYITEEILINIVKKFLNIQLFFGYPCDIEFAIKDGEIFILQSRKITSIKYLELKDIWTTADFKDGGVSATICTPYMWSLYEYIWEFVLRKFLLDSKILEKKDLERKLGQMFYARGYWNLSAVKLAMSKVIGYKEREFDSEYGIKMNYQGDGQVTKVTPKTIFKILKMAIAQKGILKERNENADNYKEDLIEKYNKYKEVYDNNRIQDIEKVWYTLTKKVYLQSEATYFWQIFINTVHQALYKDSLLKYVSESDYLVLLSSIENISHLLPFYDIWDLSREIKKDKESLNYWKESNISQIKSDINSDKYSISKVRELINKYGYHSDKELDVTYPCYYEEIDTIIQNIKDMIALEEEFSPYIDKKQGKEKYESILNNIEEKVGVKKFAKIKDKIEKMRKMLWWREEFRDISTRFYYLIRIYTIKLAEKYMQDGVIEDINDIWYLNVSDIWDYIDKKSKKDDLIKIIEKNKIYYNSYKNYMSENEIGNMFNSQEGIESNESELIKGIGANSGIVTGRARVISDFNEIDRIEQNDILITKFTDTGWTPKFAILSGIVTEYGGILCHAAIVSREYGIPAIVSCHDIMNKIKDGMKITIDGATGIIKIEE